MKARTTILDIAVEFVGIVKVAQVSESVDGIQRTIPPIVTECIAFTMLPTNRRIYIPMDTLEYMPRSTHVIDAVISNPAIPRFLIVLEDRENT